MLRRLRLIKSCLFLLLALLNISTLSAQKNERIILQILAEYDYNYTQHHLGSGAAVAQFRPIARLQLSAGAQWQTINACHFTAAITPDFPLRHGTLYLENRYLYKMFIVNNIQELNVGLSVGYRAKYWKIQAGYAAKFFTQLQKNGAENRDFVFEPINFLYLLEGRIFPSDHRWNLGARVSNFDHFLLERYGNPIFSILGNFAITPDLKAVAAAGVRPAGITNVNANFWGCFVQLGMRMSW